jgi:hypothetical protein
MCQILGSQSGRFGFSSCQISSIGISFMNRNPLVGAGRRCPSTHPIE